MIYNQYGGLGKTSLYPIIVGLYRYFNRTVQFRYLSSSSQLKVFINY